MKNTINSIASRYKLYQILIVFAIVVGTTIWWYLLDSGLCVSQMRYLSDRELIESALRHDAAEGKMLIDGSNESIRDFLEKHPRCCGVDRHPQSRIVLDVMTGFNISHVELNYERRRTEAEIEKNYQKYYKNYIAIDACGPVLKTEYGSGTETLETPY